MGWQETKHLWDAPRYCRWAMGIFGLQPNFEDFECKLWQIKDQSSTIRVKDSCNHWSKQTTMRESLEMVGGRILNMWSLDNVTCSYLENGISGPSLTKVPSHLVASSSSRPASIQFSSNRRLSRESPSSLSTILKGTFPFCPSTKKGIYLEYNYIQNYVYIYIYIAAHIYMYISKYLYI